MAFVHKQNSGSLFPPSDKAPDGVMLSGQVNVDDTLYWITVWKKDREDQKQWNISLKKKEVQPVQQPVQQQDPIPFDDDIPFR